MERRGRSGFTLIEVAIVLVIVGLLIAGIMKGTELLTSARVRNIIKQHEGVRAAYLGFMDRYRQPPGDFSAASTNITGLATTCGAGGNGNGDGRISIAGGEYLLAWEHLTKAGLLNGSYTCTANDAVNDGSAPRNAYGGYLQLVYDDVYAGPQRLQHNLKSGNNVPSDILAEIDRKVDDGSATSGSFRGSTYTAGAPTDAGCWDAGGNWSAATVAVNCTGALLF